jgi:hypothetical protein
MTDNPSIMDELWSANDDICRASSRLARRLAIVAPDVKRMTKQRDELLIVCTALLDLAREYGYIGEGLLGEAEAIIDKAKGLEVG